MAKILLFLNCHKYLRFSLIYGTTFKETFVRCFKLYFVISPPLKAFKRASEVYLLRIERSFLTTLFIAMS